MSATGNGDPKGKEPPPPVPLPRPHPTGYADRKHGEEVPSSTESA